MCSTVSGTVQSRRDFPVILEGVCREPKLATATITPMIKNKLDFGKDSLYQGCKLVQSYQWQYVDGTVIDMSVECL